MSSAANDKRSLTVDPQQLHACAAALWAMAGTEGTEQQILEFIKCAASRDLVLSRENASRLEYGVSMLRKLHTSDDVAVPNIAEELGKYCTRKVPKSPLERIFGALSEVNGLRAFMTKDDKSTVSGRNVEMHAIIATRLQRRIQRHIDSNSFSNTTIIVGGPSGGGKTVALLAQTQQHGNTSPIVVAYLRPDDDEIGDSVLKGLNKDAQTRAVQAFIVGQLLGMLCGDVIDAMSHLESGLRLLVAVDEMGSYSLAVRAMCRLRGDGLKVALEERFAGKAFPQVQFGLAAAGTGIGSRDDSNGKTFRERIGSENCAFEYYSAFDGSDELSSRDDADENMEIFLSYFSSFANNEVCANTELPRLIRVAASGNARMAAILGKQLASSFQIFDSKASEVKLLRTLDLTQFLGPAIVEFKRLNGLKGVPAGELWTCLVKAVRMHFFPYALTVDARKFEVSCGLVVSRVTVDASCPPSAGWSPIGLPFFSVALLALLCGNRVITQSVASGEALEEYVLGTFFVLACAACDEELFLRALDYNDGVMAPLWNVGLEKEKETRTCAGGSFSSDVFLPPPRSVPLYPLAHDMFRIIPFAQQGDGAVSQYLEEMGSVLNDFREQLPKMQQPSSFMPVAVFRSPGKIKFADIVALVGRFAFVIQIKDVVAIRDASYELWKMGYHCKETTEAFEKVWRKKKKAEDIANDMAKDMARPHALLKGILEAWLETTGVAVERVIFCFASSTAKCAAESRAGFEKNMTEVNKSSFIEALPYYGGDGLLSASLDPNVRFVSVEKLTFFEFDANRRVAAPYAHGALGGSLFTKSELTPPSKGAGDESEKTSTTAAADTCLASLPPSPVPATPTEDEPTDRAVNLATVMQAAANEKRSRGADDDSERRQKWGMRMEAHCDSE